MHINPNNSGNLPHLSPIFSSQNISPYLSPLLQSSHRKPSNDDIDLLNFRLERDDDDYDHHNQYFREDIQQPCLLQDPQEKPHFQPQVHVSQNLKKEEQQVQEQKVIITKSTLSLGDSKVQAVIEFLVENSKLPEEALMTEGRSFYQGSKDLLQVFRILMHKFKKLKKTKEEMTKYCMRKAFKFVIDKEKKDKKNSKDIDNCMKRYFETTNSNSNISIPFKKNSSEKTMNGNFLKKVFAQTQFVADYKQFLQQFPDLIIEDNEKKIKYLAELIDEYLTSSNLKKIESIKRLPWTKQILTRTSNLSKNLLIFAESSEENEIEA